MSGSIFWPFSLKQQIGKLLSTGSDAMKIYDISLTISPNMITWPGNPSTQLERFKKLETGANNNVSVLRMSVHSGTHIDAPFHFLPEGIGVDAVPLDVLIGEAQVVHLPDCELVTAEILEQAGIRTGMQRLLLRTRNSVLWAENRADFQPDFVGISPDGAETLVKLGIKLIGLDYLSIASYQKSRPTHEILLKAGIIPLEGIQLQDVPAGFYQLVCLPLKLSGADGTPARAVLIDMFQEG
jgi:arylformamidase